MTDIEKRIEEGRAALRRRFGEGIRSTPSLSDKEPQGTGPRNRHGMPQVPPRQNVLSTWPVLDCADQPMVSTERWELRVEGEVEVPLHLRWNDFLALPQAEDVSDFHLSLIHI